MLAHNVLFTLKNPQPAAIEHLLAQCRQYLAGHAGVEFFGCGTLSDLDRPPLNDRNFHVGLHMIFKARAAHDAYQVHERHLRFIEENKDGWSQVRVFDTDL